MDKVGKTLEEELMIAYARIFDSLTLPDVNDNWDKVCELLVDETINTLSSRAKIKALHTGGVQITIPNGIRREPVKVIDGK